MPRGSVVYFLSTVYHGGGSNKTSKSRRSMTVQYCQPYCRQIENVMISLSPSILTTIPPRIKEMLGFRLHPPFIGYVDGVNPERGFIELQERILNEQKHRL